MNHVELAYDAPEAARAVLTQLGRTEDIRFFPDGRRFVLPAYNHNSIAVFGVDVRITGGRVSVSVTDAAELVAPGLEQPHAVDFLDEQTMVVVNRRGGVAVFRLDAPDHTLEHARLVPIDPRLGSRFELLEGPSALAIADRNDGDRDLLVGHRHAGVLTRHVLHTGDADALTVKANEVLLREGIVIVDCVTVSADGAWIAMSNPWHQSVALYERTVALGETSEPDCILRGALYPHGVCFGPDGRHLFVADAGSPHVYVHARDGDSWHGVLHPVASVRVMDDHVFQRGRFNSRDGGPKGLDLHPSGRVLAVTSEFEPLVFLDVVAIVEGAAARPVLGESAVSRELALADAADTRVEEQIAALKRSRLFRVAARLHRLKVVRRRWRARLARRMKFRSAR